MRLSNPKVVIWVIIWGGMEGGVQFAGLIFARISVFRNTCIMDHTPMGLLIYYGPLVIKVL
jgi:hypothetical protein